MKSQPLNIFLKKKGPFAVYSLPPVLIILNTLLCLAAFTAKAQDNLTISGYVYDIESGESLPGVYVQVLPASKGIGANADGYYSISFKKPAKDSVTLKASMIGFKDFIKKVPATKNQKINIRLQPDEITLDKVEITSKKKYQKESEVVSTSTVDLDMDQVENAPMIFGEKDIMKTIQLLPGVQNSSEGFSGIHVRGGGPDQNLILLDGATIYNPQHLFGFFSTFNGDAIKSTKLIKGGFPAEYGGRLSSVIDIRMKDGHQKGIHGEFGLGLISSRFHLEGPIIKDKLTFMASARRTYLDVITRPFMNAIDGASAGYFFHDYNAKLAYRLDRGDRISLGFFNSKDQFSIRENYSMEDFEAGLKWGNTASTLSWKRALRNDMYANLSLIYSNFNFSVFESSKSEDETFELDLYSGIRDIALHYDIDYYLNDQHKLKFGWHQIWHHFTPNAFVVESSYEQDEDINRITSLDAMESGLYVQDQYSPHDKWKIQGGLRMSWYALENKHYIRPEPRLIVSHQPKENWAIKAAYAEMNQYIHMLTSNRISLPSDLWLPTTERLQPQRSRQIAAGAVKDYPDLGFSVTAEAYYKTSQNVKTYKEGTSFIVIPDEQGQLDWEDNITEGSGRAYGMELLLQKKVGKITGWLGYTLSRTTVQFDDVNNGERYHPRYDRRHDISLTCTYKINDKITLSGIWVYGTGNALSIPQSEFPSPAHMPGNANSYSNGYPGGGNSMLINSSLEDYGGRNSFREKNYHRLDLSIQFHKEKEAWGKPYTRTWDISIYNVYSRQNPFFYFFEYDYDANTSTSTRKLKRVTVFPILPSVSYSLKF